MTGLTALVLAGTRAGGDSLAAYAGVSHKALIDVGGRPMLERVVTALASVPAIGRVRVAIERPELLDALDLSACGIPVEAMPAAAGPSASVAAELDRTGTPLLVTTADHALLQPAWVEDFLARVPEDCDVAALLAPREAIVAALPETQRTYLRFADGQWSGCNLFLMASPRAVNAVRLWQQVEAERKRPLRLVRRLGWSFALRYALGRLTLAQALARLGELAGARAAVVESKFGLAAVDVDKPADLDLVRRLVTSETPDPTRAS